MNWIIRVEEIGLFLLGIYFFSLTNYQWWWFIILLLLPDISMVGYIIDTKIGAWSYNFIHSRIMGTLCVIAGLILNMNVVILFGSILFCHTAMDRVFHYGLKYTDSFKNTHLGKL